MNHREKAAENCAKLRKYLDSIVASGATLPAKRDGSVNLRAVAISADVEPQVLSASGNPAAREMVVAVAAQMGLPSPGKNPEISAEAITALREILAEMDRGERPVPTAGGIIDVHSLASQIGFSVSSVSTPQGIAILAEFASARGISLPRFASLADLVRAEARGRESRRTEAIGRALSTVEAENLKLHGDLADLRAENATLRRRLAHEIDNGVGL